jgi:hypothetical protein
LIPVAAELGKVVRASFPSDFTRILSVRAHGDFAVALFDTGQSGRPYLYEVHYNRIDGNWLEGGSGNGHGWHLLSLDSDAGVQTLWGVARDGADRVRGECEGQLIEDEVENGHYLLAWWGVRSYAAARVTAFRVNGNWVDR